MADPYGLRRPPSGDVFSQAVTPGTDLFAQTAAPEGATRSELIGAQLPQSASFERGLRTTLTGMSYGSYAEEQLQAQAAGKVPDPGATRRMQQLEADMKATAPRVTDLRDINNFTDAADWAAGTLGQTTPSLALGVGGAVLGRGLFGAPAGSLLRAAPGAKHYANIGGHLGAALPGYEMGKNAAVVEQNADPTMAGLDPQTRLEHAQASGAVEAGLGSVFPALVASRLMGKGVKKALPAFLGGVAEESGTEGATALINQQIRSHLAPNRDTSGDTWEAINAAAAGAIGAAPFSAASVIPGRASQLTQDVAGKLPEIYEAGKEKAKQFGRHAPVMLDEAVDRAKEFIGTDGESGLRKKAGEWIDRAAEWKDKGAEKLSDIFDAPDTSEAQRDADFLRNGLGDTSDIETLRTRRDEMNTVARKWAEQAVNDEDVAPESRERLKRALERNDFRSEFGPMSAYAESKVMRGEADTSTLQSVTKSARGLYDKLSEKVRGIRDKLSDKDKEDGVRLSEMDTDGRRALSDYVFQNLKSGLQENPEAIKSVRAVARFMGRVFGAEDNDGRYDARREVAELHGRFDDIFENKDEFIKGLGQFFDKGEVESLFGKLPATFASDANKQGSVFDRMLSQEARQLTPGQRKELAHQLERYTRDEFGGEPSPGQRESNTREATARHVFERAFGDKARFQAVLEHYGARYDRNKARLPTRDEKEFDSDTADMGVSEVVGEEKDDSGSDALTHEDQQSIQKVDAPRRKYHFDQPHKVVPYFSEADAKKGMETLSKQPEHAGRSFKVVSMREYAESKKSVRQHAAWLAKRLDKEASEDLEPARRATKIAGGRTRADRGMATKKLLEMRADKTRASDIKFLEQFHVLASEGQEHNALVATDEDLSSFRGRIRAKKDPGKAGQEEANKHNKAIDEGSFTVKMRDSHNRLLRVGFNAESIIARMAHKAGEKDPELKSHQRNRKKYMAEMFQEGLAALLARSDVEKIEDSAYDPELLLDSESGLRLKDVMGDENVGHRLTLIESDKQKDFDQLTQLEKDAKGINRQLTKLLYALGYSMERDPKGVMKPISNERKAELEEELDLLEGKWKRAADTATYSSRDAKVTAREQLGVARAMLNKIDRVRDMIYETRFNGMEVERDQELVSERRSVLADAFEAKQAAANAKKRGDEKSAKMYKEQMFAAFKRAKDLKKEIEDTLIVKEAEGRSGLVDVTEMLEEGLQQENPDKKQMRQLEPGTDFPLQPPHSKNPIKGIPTLGKKGTPSTVRTESKGVPKPTAEARQLADQYDTEGNLIRARTAQSFESGQAARARREELYGEARTTEEKHGSEAQRAQAASETRAVRKEALKRQRSAQRIGRHLDREAREKAQHEAMTLGPQRPRPEPVQQRAQTGDPNQPIVLPPGKANQSGIRPEDRENTDEIRMGSPQYGQMNLPFVRKDTAKVARATTEERERARRSVPHNIQPKEEELKFNTKFPETETPKVPLAQRKGAEPALDMLPNTGGGTVEGRKAERLLMRRAEKLVDMTKTMSADQVRKTTGKIYHSDNRDALAATTRVFMEAALKAKHPWMKDRYERIAGAARIRLLEIISGETVGTMRNEDAIRYQFGKMGVTDVAGAKVETQYDRDMRKVLDRPMQTMHDVDPKLYDKMVDKAVASLKELLGPDADTAPLLNLYNLIRTGQAKRAETTGLILALYNGLESEFGSVELLTPEARTNMQRHLWTSLRPLVPITDEKLTSISKEIQAQLGKDVDVMLAPTVPVELGADRLARLGGGNYVSTTTGREVLAVSLMNAAMMTGDTPMAQTVNILAHHEAMHSVLSRLTAKYGTEALKNFYDAAQQPHIVKQVEAQSVGFAEGYLRKNPEEMLVQAYGLWVAGKLDLKTESQLEGFFNQIKAIVDSLLKMITGDAALAELFAATQRGEVANLKNEDFSGSFKDRQAAKYLNYSKIGTDQAKVQTRAERQQAVTDFERIVGPKIMLYWRNSMNWSGRWSPNDPRGPSVTISTLATDPTSVAWHEAMHVIMDTLIDKASRTLMKVPLQRIADSGIVMRRLEVLLKDHPSALEQIRKDPAERLAYMFQFHRSGDLRVGPETKNVFAKIMDLIHWVTGTVSKYEQANRFMDAIYDGRFSDPSLASQVIADLKNETISQKAQRLAGPVGNAVYRYVTATTDRLRNTGIPALVSIAEQFHREPGREQGGLGFLQERARMNGVYMNRMLDAVRGLGGQVDMQQLLREMRSGPPTSEAGIKLAAVLADMHQYMVDAGVKRSEVVPGQGKVYKDLGNLKNYFPQVWNRSAILDDESGFVQALTKTGMSPLEAKKLHDIVTKPKDHDDINGAALGHTPWNRSLGQRKYHFTGDQLKVMERYLVNDLNEVLTTYSHQATHRAEYTRRFDNGGERLERMYAQAAKEGATGEELQLAKQAVSALDGTLGAAMDPKTRQIAAGTIVYENLILLPLALFSSLIDPLGVGIRSNNWRDAAKAFTDGIGGLINDIRGTENADREMARTLGIIDEANIMERFGDAYNGQFMSKRLKKINDKFFRWNGMDSWNKSMRTSAMVAGERFMLLHTTNPTEQSARYLRELGLEEGDIVEMTSGSGRIAKLESDGLNKQEAQRVQRAIFKFVDGAVARPNAAHRPIWGSDPHYQLIFHLKQFTYSMQQTMHARVAHEASYDNLMPMWTLMSAVPFMAGIGMVQAMMLGASGADVSTSVLRAISRSGVLGTKNFALDIALDPLYGSIPGTSLLGPAADHAVEAGSTLVGHEGTSGTKLFFRSIPGGGLLKHAA